jgi:hypothetical protein
MITPHGRSGSIFMQSLFDCHPEIASIPAFNLSYQLEKKSEKLNDFIDKFVDLNPDIFDTSFGYLGQINHNVTSLFGLKKDSHLKVNKFEFKKILVEKEFKDHILYDLDVTRRDFWIGVHLAYVQLIGKDPERVKYIVFQAHSYNSGDHNIAIEDFPDMYYIAMTRDPREDWLSWKKVTKIRDGWYHFATLDYHRFVCISEYAKAIRRLVTIIPFLSSGHLIIIDLNRLHAANSYGMRKLASTLKIGFEESLLLSTFNGQIWEGNSADRKPVHGFDANKVRLNWRSELSSSEVDIISTSLNQEIRLLNYETVDLPTYPRLKYPIFSSLIYHFMHLTTVPRSNHLLFGNLPLGLVIFLRMTKFPITFPLFAQRQIVEHRNRLASRDTEMDLNLSLESFL